MMSIHYANIIMLLWYAGVIALHYNIDCIVLC